MKQCSDLCPKYQLSLLWGGGLSLDRPALVPLACWAIQPSHLDEEFQMENLFLFLYGKVKMYFNWNHLLD